MSEEPQTLQSEWLRQPRILKGTLRLLIVVALLGWNGCSLRHGVSYERYHLAPVGGTDFLLPPGFAKGPKGNLEMRVMLGRLGRGRGSKDVHGCSIHGRWFSLDSGGSGKAPRWFATVPRPEAWSQTDLPGHARAEWNHFLDQLGELQTKGCISFRTYLWAKRAITESMPVPIFYASVFQSSVVRAGYVTLEPGVRLLVVRSIFRVPGGKQTPANYAGERKIYYRTVRQHGDEVALKRSGVDRSKGLSRNADKQFPDDAMLAATYNRMGAIRLYFWSWYLPPNLKRSALLVGVRSPADMIQVARRVAKNAEIPCRDLKSAEVTCTSFKGMVSASAEIDVRVNGKEKYFSVGSIVQTVLMSVPPREQTEAWKTLRIRRLFRGRYYDVEFGHNDNRVRQLPLLAGDRISWGAAKAPR